MVRKTRSPPPTPLTDDEISALMMKNLVAYKDKTVDLDSVITRANVKKYLTLSKLNHKPEQWVTAINKVIGGEPLTPEDEANVAEAKVAVATFLEDCSKAKQEKFGGAADDAQVLKQAVSGFKYKFSVDAFEIITHVINLFVREIIIHANEQCIASKLRVVSPSHVPWKKMHSKLLAGVYFNTLAVYEQVHAAEDEDDDLDEAAEEAEEAEAEAAEAEPDADLDADAEPVVAPKIKLRQYIQTMFKALRTSEERFNEVKLSQKLIAVINDIIYQVLDRYANVLKTLLDVSDSKTVNGKFALHATKTILQDHIFATDEKTRTVLDVVQERLERLHEQAAKRKEEAEEAPVEEPVAEAPKKGRVAKK